MKNDSRAVGKETGRGLLSVAETGGGLVGLAAGCDGCCCIDCASGFFATVGLPAKSVQPSRMKAIFTSMQEM